MLSRKKITKDVVGALIEKDGKFLIAQRNLDDTFGGLWEFPGGCIEPGETKEYALKREIKEELGVDIKVGKLVLSLTDEIPTLKINISLFESKIENGAPSPIECKEIRWTGINEMEKMELAPADIKILKWLKHENR